MQSRLFFLSIFLLFLSSCDLHKKDNWPERGIVEAKRQVQLHNRARGYWFCSKSEWEEEKQEDCSLPAGHPQLENASFFECEYDVEEILWTIDKEAVNATTRCISTGFTKEYNFGISRYDVHPEGSVLCNWGCTRTGNAPPIGEMTDLLEN